MNNDRPVYKPGERFVGVTTGTTEHNKSEPWGYFGAADPMPGKSAWRTPRIEFARRLGTLVIVGGLVFGGAPTTDRKSKQYISVLSGLGGGTSARRDTETVGKVVPGGTVWTLALID